MSRESVYLNCCVNGNSTIKLTSSKIDVYPDHNFGIPRRVPRRGQKVLNLLVLLLIYIGIRKVTSRYERSDTIRIWPSFRHYGLHDVCRAQNGGKGLTILDFLNLLLFYEEILEVLTIFSINPLVYFVYVLSFSTTTLLCWSYNI